MRTVTDGLRLQVLVDGHKSRQDDCNVISMFAIAFFGFGTGEGAVRAVLARELLWLGHMKQFPEKSFVSTNWVEVESI